MFQVIHLKDTFSVLHFIKLITAFSVITKVYNCVYDETKKKNNCFAKNSVKLTVLKTNLVISVTKTMFLNSRILLIFAHVLNLPEC